jgi:hypothetical protein
VKELENAVLHGVVCTQERRVGHGFERRTLMVCFSSRISLTVFV